MIIGIHIWVMKNRCKGLNGKDYWYYWLRDRGCKNQRLKVSGNKNQGLHGLGITKVMNLLIYVFGVI